MRGITMMLMLVLSVPFGVVAAGPHDARSLSFRHTHTGRALTVTYFADGEYVSEALTRVEEFLADFRNGELHRIDPALLDLLVEIQQATGSTGAFEVISAYRSPATNEMLRKQGRGVARKSMHIEGQAIDVRLTDVDTATLRDTALDLGRGGVGYYEVSDFVHVDTGRVRRW